MYVKHSMFNTVLLLNMLNLTHLDKIRSIDNAFIYLHFLDSFLEGISDQRNRIKELVANHDRILKKLFSSDALRETGEESHGIQRNLFREIRIFFWWWHSTYKLLWAGERIKVLDGKTLLNIGGTRVGFFPKYKKTKSLVVILPETFSNVVRRYIPQIREFSNTRSDLEHIIERIHRGVRDLGNLHSSSSGSRKFTFDNKEIDISDAALDIIDSVVVDINQWLQEQ